MRVTKSPTSSQREHIGPASATQSSDLKKSNQTSNGGASRPEVQTTDEPVGVSQNRLPGMVSGREARQRAASDPVSTQLRGRAERQLAVRLAETASTSQETQVSASLLGTETLAQVAAEEVPAVSAPPLNLTQLRSQLADGAQNGFLPGDDTQVLESIAAYDPQTLYNFTWGSGSSLDRLDMAEALNKIMLETPTRPGLEESMGRALDNLAEAVLTGNGTVPEAERLEEAAVFTRFLAASSPAEMPEHLSRKIVDGFAKGLANNIDAGLSEPSPAAVNGRLEGIMTEVLGRRNEGSETIPRDFQFDYPAEASAIAPLAARLETEGLVPDANGNNVIDRLITKWTPQQEDQISKAVMDPEWLAENSAVPGDTLESGVPGVLENYVSNMNRGEAPGLRAQFMESMMRNLDTANEPNPFVPLSREETVDKALGALTHELLLDPNTHLEELYYEDRPTDDNQFNTSGRAFATYLKGMLESGFLSDVKALAVGVTVPTGYEVPLVPGTDTVDQQQLNADKLEHFTRAVDRGDQSPYPAPFVGGYFAGSVQRAVNQLEAEASDVEAVKTGWATVAIDTAQTAVQALPGVGVLGSAVAEVLGDAAAMAVPGLFDNMNGAETSGFQTAMVNTLTPEDANGVQLTPTYQIEADGQFPGILPVLTLETQAGNLSDLEWDRVPF